MKCKICNSTDVSLYLDNVKAINLIHASDIKNDYKYYKCNICRTIFLDPVPAKEEITKVYNSDYYLHWEKDIDKNSNIRTETSNLTAKVFFKKIKNSGGRLLDVGCALGSFLNVVSPSFSEVYGVETSKYALDHVINKKINLSSDLTHFEDNYFDVITAWEVLEHTENPEEFMKEIKRILKPGGHILVTTPNADSVSLHILKDTHQMVTPPEHINIFSKKSLKYLLEKEGFTNIKIDCSGRTSLNPTLGIYSILMKLLGKNVNEILIEERKSNQIYSTSRKKLNYIVYDFICKIISFPFNLFGKGDSLMAVARK